MTQQEYDTCLRKNPDLAKRNPIGNKGAWPCASDEKQQNDFKGKAVHQARKTAVDEKLHPQYVLTVDLRVSDKRKRDADGALTTIMDCIVSAVGRLGEMDKKNSGECGGCSEG